ncbi:hypothetical protein phytr_10160 [Candidatus Phycorickettsia trachydisci]|uniref:CdiA toxin EC869-like domain-containing protein n=1 Tax=Candidatus Phycorickettsia trachydisci TaxID=2115978 RepID=A0A2P1P9J3_9RICK|nr:hypothetical protein [Candidatus Phycorickettsia trachydisci]AVP87944.1 hypothetical protein phytr_10160 [Candidatus Phycorickettsia trachydisci]
MGAKTYQNATKLEYVIRKDIDRLVKFNKGELGKYQIEPHHIQSKVLEIAVPDLGSFSQQMTLNKRVNYGKSVGIDVKIIVYKD